MLSKLKSLFRGTVKPPKVDDSNAPIGSNRCKLRRALFPTAPLDQCTKFMPELEQANNLIQAGNKAEALEVLKGALVNAKETRVELLICAHILRLDPLHQISGSDEVLGLVYEVPMHGKYDTLAFYKDGSCRYYNYSGATFICDIEIQQIKEIITKCFAEFHSLQHKAKPRASIDLPASGMQVTILTRSGTRSITDVSIAQLNMAAPAIVILQSLTRKS